MIAIAIWFFRGGRGSKNASGQERPADLLDYLLPRDIYTHVSARVDITLYVFERLLRPLWATALILSVGTFAETQVIAGLNVVIGSGPALDTTYGWMLLYSLVTLLLYDFVFYVIHYTEHKVPALWVIHKVHHSAEVLTPLTRYREHFLEGPIYAAGAAVAYGIAGGLFSWLLEADITQATLFNIGFFSLLFGFNGSFRHYHVAFHYPVWLSKWLQSPVMHHTHHSYLEKHWDTNLAAVTSIWDRLFGTLYIP
ncbi:MAG: sterol desaturase family protein, partial [Pseudomonadota bacterium]|nr:sterol desaturase family protein [Pseudomonadota bacterium]